MKKELTLQRSIGLLTLLLIASFLTFTSTSQAGVDVWTNTTVSPGVTLKSKTYTSLFNSKQNVNVLEINLATSGLEVKPIYSSSSCQKTSTLAANAGAVAAINGGFFGNCQTVSMVKINNSVLATNPGYKPARSTFGISSTNAPLIAQISSTNSWSAAKHALGGGPNLLTNGAVNVTTSQEGFDPSFESRAPRTAVGFTSSNTLMLVTVDGRNVGGAAGMTLNELATYMTYLGCSQAMNLDGGGSTTMWTSGSGIVNNPSDGTERTVVSALGIFAAPAPAPVVVTVDNGTAGFTASSNWYTSTSTPGYLGSNYHVRSTAAVSDAATWKANLTQAGSYKVYARWTAGSNRPSAVPYIVYHTGGSTTVNINQQINGGQWMLLGTFNLASGNSTRVALSCWTTTGFFAIADGIRLEKQ